MRVRNRRGFTLIAVLLLGAILLAIGTTVFSLAINRSRTATGERDRAEAYLSAESALAAIRNRLGSRLLALDDRAETPLPDDTGPFGLYKQGDQFYLAYPRLSFDGTVLGLSDLMRPEPLPDTFEATALKDRTPSERWWLHQLGAVRWIPLSIAEVAESGGILPVAVRQVEVVGESGGDGTDGRQAIAQTLRLSVNLNDPATTRRPEVALGAVAVTRVDPQKQPPFWLKAVPGTLSRVRVEGPILVDAPRIEGDWVRLEGRADLSAKPARNPETGKPYAQADGNIPAQPLNRGLFAQAANKEDGFLMVGGNRRFAKAGDIDLSASFESLSDEDVPGTLQLSVPFAERIGKAGTVLRKDFNDLNNVVNPRGEKIYDAVKSQFDFNKARRGIFYIEGRSMALKGQPFRVFTYKGRGTLVITGKDNCLSLENASLVPVSAADSLAIVCALKPLPPGSPSATSPGSTASTPTDSTASTTTQSTASVPAGLSASTPGGAQRGGPPPAGPNGAPPPLDNKPAGVRLLFSSAIPVTVLANARGVPFTVANKDVQRDIGAPPNLPTTLNRLISSVNIGDVSIPSGARSVNLDKRNYILAALSDRGEPEVLISLGANARQQQGTLQRESVRGEVQVVPLLRLQAQVFSNAPFISEGSARIVGSIFAPSITLNPPRYSANTQNLLYGDNKFGLRLLFDAIYRRLEPTVGSELMTFRPRQRFNPFQPVTVARIDGTLWQRFNFDQWRQPPTSTPPQEGTP
ncbi:hypothetical protein [Gloeobacter kilaueensis]|uniref:Tfp pilus assembly protein PilX n=1 Tax=Gloeobacter kilaueensis (strain ATCC BAA-2537 / CCAP 1431/1 / ULC 316 / JS1) TaxID=1183438 RepID=U5QQ83_GLOK1|nr:hypothetical protein [Gloeobacter kilaueensis]AGY59794.1 Tfp pilus assembly protein PilX [Gloeobacter kilaueensis JS1]